MQTIFFIFLTKCLTLSVDCIIIKIPSWGICKGVKRGMSEHCNCKCENKKTPRSQSDVKKLVSRINRINGQLCGVKNMIEQNKYCQDILIQLSAIEKAVRSLSACVLEDHLHTCVVEKIQGGDLSALDELVQLYKKY